MNIDEKISTCSFVALGFATLASAFVAFDPLPQGMMMSPRPQAATLLVSPAAAAETEAPTPIMDRDFDMS